MTERPSTAAQVRAAVELPWEPAVIVRFRTAECVVRPHWRAYNAESDGRAALRMFANALLVLIPDVWTRGRADVAADVLVTSAVAAPEEVRFAETWLAFGPEVAVIAAARLPLRAGPTTVAHGAWLGSPAWVRVRQQKLRRDQLILGFNDDSVALVPVARGTAAALREAGLCV